MDCIKAYAPRNDGGEGGAMMVGRGGMVESGVSLRTNVKQSRKVGNGLPRLTARNDKGEGGLQ